MSPGAGLCLLVLAAAALAGCQAPGAPRAAGGAAGATTGTVTTALTANPALGAAVGIGTRALVDAGVAYAGRRLQRVEQDAVAAAIGGMAVGETRPWQAENGLPWPDRRGEVRILRTFETGLATCKEAAFSLDPGGQEARRWFVTTACRQAEGWRWAAAAPATPRWSSLQ
jgi:hypothetical protein